MRVVFIIFLGFGLVSGNVTAQSVQCDSVGHGYPNTAYPGWHAGAQTDCTSDYAPAGPHCDSLPRHPVAPPPCGCARCQEQHIYVSAPCEGGEPENYPGEPESAPAPPAAVPAGAFVAPPRSGVEQEAGRSFGISGMGLRFPEMRLRLPSIELPRIIKFRHGRQMQLNRSTAPFVAETPQQAAPMMSLPVHAPVAAMQMAAAPMQMRQLAVTQESAPLRRQEAAPESAPESIQAAPGHDVEELCERVDGLQQQLRERQLELQRQMQELNECMSRLSQSRAAPMPTMRGLPRPAPCNCPKCQSLRRPAPACDTVRPAYQFERMPKRRVVPSPSQPEPVPLPQRYPAPSPMPAEPATPATGEGGATSPTGAGQLSEIPADLLEPSTTSLARQKEGVPAVLRLPQPE